MAKRKLEPEKRKAKKKRGEAAEPAAPARPEPVDPEPVDPEPRGEKRGEPAGPEPRDEKRDEPAGPESPPEALPASGVERAIADLDALLEDLERDLYGQLSTRHFAPCSVNTTMGRAWEYIPASTARAMQMEILAGARARMGNFALRGVAQRTRALINKKSEPPCK